LVVAVVLGKILNFVTRTQTKLYDRGGGGEEGVVVEIYEF
jgi:hypothetical protein